jgi:hypothetical protein
MEPDRVRARSADNSFFGDSDLRSPGSADVGVKDIFPDCRARSAGNVFHVKHMVFEALIEDMGLDLERNLGSSQLILQARQGCGGAWLHDHGIYQRQHPGGNTKY